MTIARHLQTGSLSNQNISSALAVGSYTADADRMVVVQVLADQVAGNGDYEFYMTLQVNGAGSHYRLIPVTSAAAASGLTAVGAQSGMVAVRSGDVLTCYLKGLAGDNATPDTIVRWFELDALQPATAGRTLAVDASGIAEANVKQWQGVAPLGLAGGSLVQALIGEGAHGSTSATLTLGRLTLSDSTMGGKALVIQATNPVGGKAIEINGGWKAIEVTGDVEGLSSLTAQGVRDAIGMAAADLDAQLDAIAACGAGSGAVSYPITVNNESSNPIDGVEVWITTDSAGTNVVAGTLSTDASGIVTFMLDAGSYYVWRQKSGYNFTNPVAITVT